MPIVKPIKLSARGIFAELLPNFFRRPKHPAQSLDGDSQSVKVPLDADETFHYMKKRSKKFRAAVLARNEVNDRFGKGPRPRDTTWCVATACFVLRRQTLATHLYPLSLCSTVMAFTFGIEEMWSAANGLMLPNPMKRAFDDSALMIVPNKHQGGSPGTRPEPYRFCVIDSNHPAMSQPLFSMAEKHGLPKVITGELDGQEVALRNIAAPKKSYLYFQSCFAVWRKTYLENPECDDEADFTARFLSHISEYWPPEAVERNKTTDIFLFKYRDAVPDSPHARWR